MIPSESQPDYAASTRLPDGRRLAYMDSGDPSGRAVFFFHGMPGSRLQRHPDDTIARTLGLRLITVDRPGCGLSDFQRGRRLLDWPRDIARLADDLGIRRFAAVGWSGGGPYVAACAHGLPERVAAGALVSSFAPLELAGGLEGIQRQNRSGFLAARRLPWPLARWLWRTQFRAVRGDPRGFYDRWARTIPEHDRAVMTSPEIFALMVEDLAELLRAGTDGYAWDFRILARPWGFRLEEIRVPVHVWHGEEDVQAPLAMGQALARAIPGCRATFLPAEGHFLLFPHWSEILTPIAAP